MTTGSALAETMNAPTIYQALADVMADVDHVAKRDRNSQQGFNFRGIDAVVNAVGPVLRKHHVIVVPTVMETAYDNVTTTNNKPATACRVTVQYTFYGPRGDNVSATVIGEAWDWGDKAAPKAMSVAFRTALIQALALPTDESDPDSQTFERSRPTDNSIEGVKSWEERAACASTLDEVRTLYAQAKAENAPPVVASILAGRATEIQQVDAQNKAGEPTAEDIRAAS